jgi:hypothetical protein
MKALGWSDVYCVCVRSVDPTLSVVRRAWDAGRERALCAEGVTWYMAIDIAMEIPNGDGEGSTCK